MTHLRTATDANGDVVAYHFFCSEGCWRDSFAEDRIGPESDRVERGGAAPCAESEPAAHEEIHCAECGVLMASPWRISPIVVNLIPRPPISEATGEAEPVDFLDNPLLDQAHGEHHIGNWEREGGTLSEPITFRLDLWWSGRTDGPRAVVAYVLRANNTIIFSGEDYKPGPSQAPDSDESAGGLLSFLSCKPGDVEEDFFANYTPEQLEFSQTHGEELSLWAMELEDGAGV